MYNITEYEARGYAKEANFNFLKESNKIRKVKPSCLVQHKCEMPLLKQLFKTAAAETHGS